MCWSCRATPSVNSRGVDAVGEVAMLFEGKTLTPPPDGVNFGLGLTIGGVLCCTTVVGTGCT